MDRATKFTLAIAALIVGAYIAGVYVDCAYDQNCKIEARRTGPTTVRTEPSKYFSY